MDKGYSYQVPDRWVEKVQVGSMVRVPLGPRRVRGFVVEIENGPDDDQPTLFSTRRKLKDITGVSGSRPVFIQQMLPTLRRAAHHYVVPLSTILAKTAPPNLPRAAPLLPLPSIAPTSSPVLGGPSRFFSLLARSGWSEKIRQVVSGSLIKGQSVLVVAPTAVEAGRLAEGLRRNLGVRVVEVSDQDHQVTQAWSQVAGQGGLVVVGTVRILWWPVHKLSTIVLVEENRKGMKDRQAPTVSAFWLGKARAEQEDLTLVSVGRTPSLEAISSGGEIIRQPGRLWPLVEIVDRRAEPPGGGVIGERVRQAISLAVRRAGSVLVFCHRRGFSPAARCVACRTLRTCGECGARPDPGANCPRCGAELGACTQCRSARFEPLGAGVGRVIEELRSTVGGQVGEVTSGGAVLVGTERDLPGLDTVHLAVVVDADALVRRPDYLAGEQSLSLLARVAASLQDGPGRRMMVQTADPDHPVFSALVRSRPLPFLREELVLRAQLGFPPATEMILVEVAQAHDFGPLQKALQSVPEGVSVHGPAQMQDKTRWLIQGPDLDPVRDLLPGAVTRLRDQGARVRIDVDPRDL